MTWPRWPAWAASPPAATPPSRPPRWTRASRWWPAAIATPDWLRPGSFEPPGAPDAAAQVCYARRNPLTNLAAYRHAPAISFQNGALDRQVPPDGSQRFVAALREEVYARCPERLEVVLHEGIAHEFTAAGWANALAWFRRHLAP